jgi:hypothetical protein
MKRCLFSLFFLGLFYSCSSTSTSIVSREKLQSSSSPNIEQVVLKGGKLIVFNSNLGWYDAEHAYIEGVDMLGSRDTIPLSQVEQVEQVVTIEHQHNTVISILLILLALTIGAAFALYYSLFPHGNHGCVILIAVIALGAGTAAAIFII